MAYDVVVMTTRIHARTLAAAALAIGLTGGCGGGPANDAKTVPPAAAESPLTLNEKWRAKHEADYRRDWVPSRDCIRSRPARTRAGSAATNDIVLPASTPVNLGRFVRDDQTSGSNRPRMPTSF